MGNLVRNRVARVSVTGMLVVGLAMPWAAPALGNASGNQLVGGFEIDGNFYEGFDNNTTATGPDGDPVDWGSSEIAADVDIVADPIFTSDPTIYDQGSKEDDPNGWKDEGSAQPPNKGDVGNVYVYDRLVGNDQYVFLAFERATDNGTVTYYLELNQEANTTNSHGTPIPDRAAGDLRLTIENHGSGDFQIIDIEKWDGSKWVDAGGAPNDVIEAINDSTINVPGGTRLKDEFGEFGFNLTALGLELGCPSTGFNTLNLRSKSGNAKSNAELKDYATGAIDIPARCSAIRIKKKDPEGNLLGGATFTIEPDPTPGSNDPSLTVTDGGANDPDGAANGIIVIDPAKPGSYTITETEPPAGYIQTTAPQVGEAAEFETLTVVFENRLGTMTWEKLDEVTDDPVCCATFLVEGTAGAATGTSITVVDNGANDTNPVAGVIKVEGLKTGTYSVTETVPPVGYDLPANPTRTGIVIDSSNPDVTIGEAFVDPRLPSELKVRKLDADTGASLSGATFALYLDDGDNTPEAPGGDTLIGECTTGGNGTCTIGNLDWGTYYWYEVSAPSGYELPANRYSGLILINRDNAGGKLETTTFHDPQKRSALKIVKKDATTGDKLAGAKFVVRLDDGDGVFETGDDVIVDPPGEVTTDGSGTVIVDGLLFGTYWVEETAAPTGYELPSPAYQGPFTFNAGNAGTTIKVTFEDPQKLTDLSVQKLDQTSEETLSGAKFELYRDDGDGEPDGGDTLVGECTTGAEGVCTVTDLPFGDYYWKETVPPTGYDLPDNPYSVIITINAANAGTEITPISFFDPRRPGSLTVLKVDKTDDAPLEGAAFDLVRDDGDGVYEPGDDTVVGSCVTNATGTCSVGDLDFGTYFWVETAAPIGYDLPANPVSGPIVINAGNVDDERTPIKFRDPRLKSELSVLKLDEVDDTPLSGAKFDLVLDDGDGTYEAGDDTVVGSCTTGGDGTCTIGNLDFGTYFWVETAAPTGYGLPSDRVSGPIVINAQNAGTEISAAVFRDPRVLSELTVRKLDDANDAPLAGAVFALVLDDGDGVADNDDEFLAACLTDEDGLCTVTGLDFGTYYWIETSAPTGYDLPDNPVSDMVTISAQNAGTEFAVITFRDPRKLSELSVLKLAEDTEEPLAGATFELYLDDGDGVEDAPDEGDVLVGECTTGEDGTCTIGDLDFGDYYWYETEAPEGYLIPEDATSEIISITAANAGTAMDPVVFFDPPVDTPPPPTKPPTPDLPITGTSLGLIGLALALVVTGGVMLALNRRRNPLRGAYRA